MKKHLSIVSLMFVAFLFTALPVSAECPMGDKQCAMKQGCKHGSSKDCDGEKYQCPVTGKFMKKAEFFLDNQKEIGLSEDQVKTIKALKADVKKSYIRQTAEMQIFDMDIQNKMSETPVDVPGLNTMIDNASTGMAASAKATIESYAKLKAVLKDDQMEKVKEIWGKKEK